MDCRRLQPILSRLAEGEVEPRESIAVARHLPDCTACRILLARERRLARMLEQDLDDVISVGEDFPQDVMARLPEGPPPKRRKRRGLKVALGMLAGAVSGALAAPGVPFGLGGGRPFLPSLDLPHPEGWLAAWKGLAGLLAGVARAIGTSLPPDLPVLQGSLTLVFAVALPAGVLVLMASPLLALAAQRLYRADPIRKA